MKSSDNKTKELFFPIVLSAIEFGGMLNPILDKHLNRSHKINFKYGERKEYFATKKQLSN